MEPSFQPTEISFPLPKNPHTLLHAHLTFLTTSLMIFLTTSTIGEPSSLAAMGSFVYAMPDRTNTRNTLSTPLLTAGSSIDYATRIAKTLARKIELPVYVGCSIDSTGSTVEEEMEGLTRVVEVIMDEWKKRAVHPSGTLAA